jgi:molecular chaperone GrpE
MDDFTVPCIGEPAPELLIPPPPREVESTDEVIDTEPTFRSDAAPGAAPPLPVNELDVAIERLETSVAVGFAGVLQEFRDKLALDRFKEEQITRLHEELQDYRNDLISRTARQILQGLIRLHDSLGKVSASLRQKPAEELTPERFFQQLEGFQDDVELLLGQHEVEKFEASGEEFDPRRQTVVRTVPTDDSTQAGRVAERVRSGFQQGEALLQKERVAVYTAANGANSKT